MSRSGYTDDYDDNWSLIKWRGVVASAMRGKRGQAFFRDLLAALDAMPAKRLIGDELVREDSVCAIGALGRARGIDMTHIDPDDPGAVAGAFNIATPLVQEVVWMNDEAGRLNETPEQRWSRIRAWVASQIKQNTTGAP